MHILVVEDEQQIADFVSQGLIEEGYAVDVAATGEDALEWVRATAFDLIILDVLLPGIDGINVCRRLRAGGMRTPILMLTARDSVEDRVLGLDSGADDYLVKPFAFAELVARLRALSRREPQIMGPVLTCDGLTLDTSTRRVVRNGEVIALTAKEYALLEYLMRHPGQVLTRIMIAEHVWSYDFENATNLIDVHVRNLRRKIDDPFDAKLIRTVRGTGYSISEPEAAVE